jgi:hypothetical protein
VPGWERELVSRTLNTFLREDVAGLRSRGRLVQGARGCWLAFGRLRVPVRPGRPRDGDRLADLVAREPMLVSRQVGRRVTGRRLHAVLNLLAGQLIRDPDPLLADDFRAGFAALREEAAAALVGARLRRRDRPRVLAGLRPELAGAGGTGWRGAIGFETLAAHRDHPLYPFSLARVGLTADQVARYAPEHGPQLRLNWLTVPASTIERHGVLPDWWPPDDVALPVHPGVPGRVLARALAGIGLDPESAVRPDSDLVRPTLSLRTVVANRDPAVHLKLPLPIRTLGRLNLRTVTRAGLADGALVGGLLRRVLADAPEFADAVLVADESTWLHAGHPLLAVLIRRWDGELGGSAIVPVAGLAAIGPTGRPVIRTLAERFWDGDLDRLIADYLRLVIGWQVTLWLRYGVVLEAHPQNVLIAVDRTAGERPRLRLLLRDLDSALIDLELAADRLGESAPAATDLADPRLAAGRPDDLADLLITTTLHQCVAATLIAIAAATGRPVRPMLARVRPVLAEIADRHPDARDTAVLVHRIITADRLPVKRSLTAATLLPKTRTGALDVNKYYGADAPSYL